MLALVFGLGSCYQQMLFDSQNCQCLILAMFLNEVMAKTLREKLDLECVCFVQVQAELLVVDSDLYSS